MCCFSQDKKTPDEPQKLTPIIVTAKKIISLKRKSTTSTESPLTLSESQIESKQSPPTAKQAKVITTVAARKIPTATILPEAKRQDATTAVVKPVMKKTITVRPSKLLKEEEFDEDELLADSPPSSPIKPKVLTKTIIGGSSVTSIAPTAASPAAASRIFPNRRVIVRNSDVVGNTSSDPKQETSEVAKAVQSHKGIFDRLEKKVIGVNEAAKRKIQRIVINNSE